MRPSSPSSVGSGCMLRMPCSSDVLPASPSPRKSTLHAREIVAPASSRSFARRLNASLASIAFIDAAPSAPTELS